MYYQQQFEEKYNFIKILEFLCALFCTSALIRVYTHTGMGDKSLPKPDDAY